MIMNGSHQFDSEGKTKLSIRRSHDENGLIEKERQEFNQRGKLSSEKEIKEHGDETGKKS